MTYIGCLTGRERPFGRNRTFSRWLRIWDGVHDRLRARPPATDVDAWREGTLRAVTSSEGGYTVTVLPTDAAEPVEVRVTAAIFDLFTGRLPGEVETASDAVGATVWFR